jgi:hypothetical protein
VDRKAFGAATDKLRLAKAKLAAMKAASDLQELAIYWSEFLIEVQRVFLRLKKATENGPSKGWYDRIEQDRSTDELLSYIRHARNADEHGIERIAEVTDSRVTMGDPGEHIFIERLEISQDRVTGKVEGVGTPATVRWYPGSVRLAAVLDRGDRYEPPRRHLGKRIAEVTPIGLAELTCTYLEEVIAEAETNFG